MVTRATALCRTDLIRLKGRAPSSSFRLLPLIVLFLTRFLYSCSAEQKDFLCRCLRSSGLAVENTGSKFEVPTALVRCAIGVHSGVSFQT